MKYNTIVRRLITSSILVLSSSLFLSNVALADSCPASGTTVQISDNAQLDQCTLQGVSILNIGKNVTIDKSNFQAQVINASSDLTINNSIIQAHNTLSIGSNVSIKNSTIYGAEISLYSPAEITYSTVSSTIFCAKQNSDLDFTASSFSGTATSLDLADFNGATAVNFIEYSSGC